VDDAKVVAAPEVSPARVSPQLASSRAPSSPPASDGGHEAVDDAKAVAAPEVSAGQVSLRASSMAAVHNPPSLRSSDSDHHVEAEAEGNDLIGKVAACQPLPPIGAKDVKAEEKALPGVALDAASPCLPAQLDATGTIPPSSSSSSESDDEDEEESESEESEEDVREASAGQASGRTGASSTLPQPRPTEELTSGRGPPRHGEKAPGAATAKCEAAAEPELEVEDL